MEVIDRIEKGIRDNSLGISLVSPVLDFENDPRICLTSVHQPRKELIEKIREEIINPLKAIAPEHYYYLPDSLHMTIKNVRVINDPPQFTTQDVERAKKVFGETIPLHKKFNVYFYRLLLFPYNLSLIGSTDPEFDGLVLGLDRKLTRVGLEDDKQYVSRRYHFCNMTLVRFFGEVSGEFREKAQDISDNLVPAPYLVDLVTLLSCNGVFKRRKIFGVWQLKN